jgi:hypothetical protein
MTKANRCANHAAQGNTWVLLLVQLKLNVPNVFLVKFKQQQVKHRASHVQRGSNSTSKEKRYVLRVLQAEEHQALALLNVKNAHLGSTRTKCKRHRAKVVLKENLGMSSVRQAKRTAVKFVH